MKINLSNKFYKKEAIKIAIESFKDVCDCKIIDDSFEIELSSANGEETKIRDEFYNFVLGITKDKLLF